MSLGTELEASLKEFLAAGLVDLHENGGRTSFATGLSWEVRGDGDKPLLHLWAERLSLTRRVLAITDHSEQRLVLAVERFGRGMWTPGWFPPANRNRLYPLVQTREVWLRFPGLPFARWDDRQVYFGIGECRQELTTISQKDLKQLVQDLARYRHPLATDTRHVLYRAQPERWLESLVREDVIRVHAALDARFVYSQVFATSAGEHGILDLLTVTRSGRLAIIELKASEHIHLPLQAADYWLRVKKHLERGEISRYGYFPAVELQQTPPLVYLVAPALRFHPSTDELLKFLSPELEIVRVVMRQ